MARITTCVMRLVWSTHANNLRVAIAAQIFVNAGVIIIIIINLIFAQRILRAYHPTVGWSKATSLLFNIFYLTVILLLAALITSIVQQIYTLSNNTHRIDFDIQHVGSTYFAVAAFMPIPIVIIGLLVPKRVRIEKFGIGRFRTKIRILLTSSALITLGAAFRAGIGYVPRPVNNPAWYHSKACFYIFTFTLEIIVVFFYASARIDRRFHVPDGASGPGQYAAGSGQEKTHPPGPTSTTEDDLFDDADARGAGNAENEQNPGDWEKRAEGELESGINLAPHARAA